MRVPPLLLRGGNYIDLRPPPQAITGDGHIPEAVDSLSDYAVFCFSARICVLLLLHFDLDILPLAEFQSQSFLVLC